MRPTFVIDNAPAHARFEQLLKEHSYVRILRLAPYSYLLNPIELVWSTFKSQVKQQLRERMTYLMGITSVNGLSIAEQRIQELEVMANRAIAHITPAMIIAFLARVEKYCPLAIRQDYLIELS